MNNELWDIGMKTIKALETPEGIMASGREELYGCIFGRDSLITDLLLLKTYAKTKDPYLLALVKKSLLYLATLQGTKVNIESGEEPGKMIHEFRVENHEHLTKYAPQLWYLYEDGVMRNYDTIDATPLFLMAVREYYAVSQDNDFMLAIAPYARAALDWLMTYGDKNGDGFIDYQFHPDRTFGGLLVQSWMDSSESLFFEDSDERPVYPIAPVEAQAYAYNALSGWADYYAFSDQDYSRQLAERAADLKEKFNHTFVLKEGGHIQLAASIDGKGRLVTSRRSSMGHCLWAREILHEEYVPAIVQRLLAADIFVPAAGIRTLSEESSHFEVNSYHNGSIWPHDTAITAEGLEAYGYNDEAQRVRAALLNTYAHFQTPIELFDYSTGQDADFQEYRGPQGQGACRTQAWSAAALLATLSSIEK
jgi:glycogen debranching enzyme